MMKRKKRCIYCGKEFDPESKESKECNENYDFPIFCDCACEYDYEIMMGEELVEVADGKQQKESEVDNDNA